MLLFSFSNSAVLLFVIAILLAQNANAQHNFEKSRCNTTTGNYTADSDYKKNLDLLLSDLTSKTSVNGYAETGITDKVYGLFYCRGDLETAVCTSCVQIAAKQVVSDCPTQKDAVIWYPECTLRYYANNSDAFLEEDGNWVGQFSLYNDSDPSDIALPGSVQSIYHWRSLQSMPPESTRRRSSPTPAPVSMNAPPRPGKKAAAYYVTRVVVPVSTLALLLAAGVCFWQRKKLLKYINQQESRNVQSGMSGERKIECQVAENFSFVAMKKATGSFSDANRPGQGGFGAVYKGVLPNGEEVAIKRLSKESRQGDKEFSTEVLIVAKLQHRNLVRLLGYCEDKKERLLVYEYVPNLSLDQLLFDASKSKILDWRTRCNIIVGIARGLRYLHHESRLNIVHRDLKTSNILLDADMNPKIADFGLAKLISLEHTQGDTTKVAGTLGYMAPEYIFQGQFSTKSDVYSFGVILLEIVSGQKICKPNQSQNNEGLLQQVWRHWEEGNFEELLDPTLKQEAAEVTKCIQIALLCIQHDASTRPAMQTVLSWLNNNLVNIPSPIRPAALAFDTSTTTSIWNSSSNSITTKYD